MVWGGNYWVRQAASAALGGIAHGLRVTPGSGHEPLQRYALKMRDDSGYSHLTMRLSECVGVYSIALVCKYCHYSEHRPEDLIARYGEMKLIELGRRLVCSKCRKTEPIIRVLYDHGRPRCGANQVTKPASLSG